MHHRKLPEFKESQYFHWRYLPLRKRFKCLLDPLPLADLLLLLMLFLIVHSSFVHRPSIPLNLPTAPFLSGSPYNALVVTISGENMVFFNDERTTIEGLRTGFAQAIYQDPTATMVVEADGRVPYRTLMAVYNMAVEAGIDEVSMATGLLPQVPGTP